MMPIYIGIISGAAYGLFYGYSGYKLSGKKFSWREFLMTVIPTTIIGGAAGWKNVEYAVFSSGAIGLGITQFVKKMIRIWWRS